MNVNTEEGMEYWKKLFFSEKGYDTLYRLVQNFAKLYFEKEEKDYPLSIGIVYGIPLFKYAQKINSKEEFLGRIKALAQVLGIEKIEFPIGNAKGVLEL